MAQQAAAEALDSNLKLYVLTVNVDQGIDLPPADLGGSSDPYVITKICGEEWKTKTSTKNLNPQWKESKVFCFLKEPKTIEFVVNDKDDFTKDDSLGTAKFNCAEAFKELYLRAAEKTKESDEKDKSEREEKANGDNDWGHETQHLSSKVDSTLPLETSRKQSESSQARIQVSIECQIVQPLSTQSRLTKVHHSLDQLKEQVKQLEEEKRLLSDRIQQNDIKIAEKNTHKQELTNKIAELETETKNLENKRSGLEGDVAKLNEKRVTLSKSIENEKNGTNLSEHEQEELRSSLQQVEKNLADAQTQLKSKTDANPNFESQKQEIQNTMEEMRRVEQSLRDEINKLKTELSQSETEKNTLQRENETIKQKIATLQTQVREKTQEFDKLTTFTQSLAQQKSQLHNESDSSQNELNQIKKQLADARSLLTQRTNENTTIQNEYASLQKQFSQQGDEIQNWGARIDRLKEENSRLKSQLSSTQEKRESRNHELRDQVKELQENVGKFESENEQLSEKIRSLEDGNAELKREVQKFEDVEEPLMKKENSRSTKQTCSCCLIQ